jgi:flagellin-like hook-associated protein FlgL
VGTFLTQAKEIAVAMSNDTYDDISRQAAASQVESIIEQMVSLANTRLEQRSIFAGYRTKITPFTANAQGVVYEGNFGDIEFEVDSGQRAIINLNGADVFLKGLTDLGSGTDLDVGISASTLLANLRLGDGIDAGAGFTVTDRNLGNSVAIDLSDPAIVTVQDAIDAINAQLAAAAPPVSDVVARLGDEKNNITFDAIPSGQIWTTTRLDRLHEGAGIDLEPGVFRIYNDAGINFEVDISGAETVLDVITIFNNTMASHAATYPELANVQMSLNGFTATGFQVVDANAPPLDLIIENAPGGDPLASQLGIEGSVGASLMGEPLNPTVSFEITENGGTTAAGLGLLGEFTTDFVGTDLDALLTADDRLDLLRGGRGIDRSEIIIWQGDMSFTVDLGDPLIVTVQDLLDRINSSPLDVTASLNPDSTGIQILNDDPARSLTVTDIGTGKGSRELGIYGAPDMMGTLLVLQQNLRNNDREGTELVLEHLDNAIQSALDIRGKIGSRVQRLEATNARLVDSHLSFTKLLSEVEDADIAVVLTQLSTHETNYQSALLASAKIIQPSLLDFLRR